MSPDRKSNRSSADTRSVAVLQESDRSSGVQVIERAAQILRLLGTAPEGLTQTEISVKLDLARSTVHRILRALEREDLVAVIPPSRYRLGSTFDNLASSNREQIIGRMRPYLEQLITRVDETVHLAILEGDHTVLVDQIPAPHQLRVEARLGDIRPLHSTAKGKAVLATMTDETVRKLLPKRLISHTPNTQTSITKLLGEVRTIRQDGFAWSQEEWTVGLCSIAAPLRSLPIGPASLSIVIPTNRAQRPEQFEGPLLEIVRRIEIAFGTSPPT